MVFEDFASNVIKSTTEHFLSKSPGHEKHQKQKHPLTFTTPHRQFLDMDSLNNTQIGSHNSTANFDNDSTDNIEIGGVLRIYQLNIEGISERKCRVLESELHRENIDVAVIQETHIVEEGVRSNVEGYTMVASIHHEKFGLATYVKDDLLPLVQLQAPTPNSFHSVIKLCDQTIVNVYKPPSAQFGSEVMPKFSSPSLVIGDFNSHNPLWGYDDTDEDGLRVANWMMREDYSLVFNSSDPGTFHSARWNRSYSPDLCFVSKDINGSPTPASRRVLRGFPNSQHRPVIIEVGLKIPMIRADKKNRWNFTKANWIKFSKLIDQTILRIPANARNYERFVGLVKSAAKQTIPRGHKDTYTPGWSTDCQDLFDQFQQTGDIETGKKLLKKIDENRKAEWENKMESVNFTKSSKKAWNLINRLSGKAIRAKKVYPVTPDQIAAKLIENSKGAVGTAQMRKINKCYKSNFRNSQRASSFSAPYTTTEVAEAISAIECGKAPGIDNVFSDYLKHLGPNAIRWLSNLFTNIHSNPQMPKLWKKAKVIAILKPKKPANDPSSYRPISLLSCSLKLFERTLLARLDVVKETTTPKDQAVF